MKFSSKTIIKIIAVVLVIGVAMYLAGIAGGSAQIQSLVSQYGYPAIFVISVIGGFNVFVPIPTPSFVPLFVESGLSFWITIIVMTIGLTVADFIGFAIGRIGREVASTLQEKKIITWLEGQCEKNFWIPILFLFMFSSIAPLPNEIIVIPLAFIGYRVRHLIGPLLLGHIIFLTWTSFGFLTIANTL